MWWQDIVIVVVIALGIYGFVVLARYMTQQTTRKADRTAEDTYDELIQPATRKTGGPSSGFSLRPVLASGDAYVPKPAGRSMACAALRDERAGRVPSYLA